MKEQSFRVYSDRVVGKVLDHEAVVINLETGFYYGLDGASATVWEQLSVGVPLTTVAESLSVAYPQETGIDRQLETLVDSLVDAKLLAVSDDAAEEAPAADWPREYAPLELACYDDVAEMVALDPSLPELDYGS